MFKRVLESSKAMRIDAPAAVVWNVLTDAKSYGEWNPFTTRLETDFQVGSPIHLHIVMGPYSMDRKEWVRTVEPPRRLEWDTKVLARFLLYSSKEQRVTALTARVAAITPPICSAGSSHRSSCCCSGN